MIVIPWHCPLCHNLLEQNTFGRLTCSKCHQSWLVREGIPDFVGDELPEFYEEKGERYHQPRSVPRRRLLTRLAMVFADDDFSTNFQFLKQAMRGHGVVLDVGCGGGNMFYPCCIGPTVGIDIAFASLKQAKTIYHQVARARVEALPFPDNAFDFVVSTDLLEHLPSEAKDCALAEMYRVLKPGGRMIHIFPVDNHHFLTRWAKQFPDLYQRYFVDLDGHDGLEMAQAVLERFERLGLRVVCVSIRKGVVWSKWEVLKRFDNEYRQTACWLDGLVWLAKLFGRNRWINHAVNPLLWALDRLLTPWFGLDYAYRVGVCLEKPR